MEHSRLFYGLLAVLGIVFLTLCLVGIYLNGIDAISVFAALPSEFVLWFLSIGIFFLTVGIVGAGRQHLKRHKRLFTALAAVLVPVVFGILTWQQCHIYRDSEVLWRDTLKKNPDAIRAYYFLAKIYKLIKKLGIELSRY